MNLQKFFNLKKVFDLIKFKAKDLQFYSKETPAYVLS